MKFDELFKSVTEAYPMAPNPNLPKQQPGQQQSNQQQPNQQQTQQQPQAVGAIDPAVVDELIKANDPNTVVQILQQKLGVK